MKRIKIAGNIDNPADLVGAVSKALKDEGRDECFHDLQKASEMKSAQSALFETKANEVTHTSNTGAGTELVPGAIQTTDFLDLVPKAGNSFLSSLSGFHGRNMDKTMEVPVIGEQGYHEFDSGEWTTWTAPDQIAQGDETLNTGKLTITQKKYKLAIDVSDEMQRFTNVIDVVASIQRKLKDSSQRTIEALIINGDTETGATGNVNSDDGAPAGTSYYLGADGLVKEALVTNTNSVNIGTMAWEDFPAMMTKLGEYAQPEDCLWLFNRATYNKALTISEFSDQSKSGMTSTVASGAITNIAGSDVFVTRELGLAEADGKKSTTPGNNTLGRALYINKIAPQYGFNGEYSLELFRVPGKGWHVYGYYYMGLDIAGAQAGQTDYTAVLGYNATV